MFYDKLDAALPKLMPDATYRRPVISRDRGVKIPLLPPNGS
jgi:hypothetical protein